MAPGPANGFTLDLIDCFERFGDRIDWAMVILNPLEPWPGELVLPAAERHDVKLITRVVDYGGLFHDDVRPGHPFPEWDHRTFRPAGWVERGRERLDAMRPIAERHGLTLLQLACAWNLSHGPVRCVAPTLIQEPGDDARPVEAKRAELAAVPAGAGAQRRRGRRDPRDRRQHGQHGAQGRRAGLRRRRRGRPLAARRRARRGRRPLGHRAGQRSDQGRAEQDPIGRGVAARLTLIAGILLLALASTASAHEIVGDHIDTRSELATIDLAKVVAAINAEDDEAGLPASWCGTRRTTDYVDDPAFDTALPQFKVVYAYPNDEPDRFDQWKDALQADVSLIGRFMGAQSGGRKAPRFDMGTDCGHEYVDVQVVELPGPRSAYVNNFNAIRAAVRARLTHAGGERRNVVVLGDALSGSPVGYWSGLGTKYTSESPLRLNPSNTGNIFSVAVRPRGRAGARRRPRRLVARGDAARDDAQPRRRPDNARTPPRRPLLRRLRRDVLRRRRPREPLADLRLRAHRRRHAAGLRLRPRRLLQRRAGPGSYLATHWNVYDNVYLAGCAEHRPRLRRHRHRAARAAATGAPAGPRRPQGRLPLTATRGMWSNSPSPTPTSGSAATARRWSAVPGATGMGYTVVAADAGQRLRVRVVATNGDGGATAYSPATAPVVPPPASGADAHPGHAGHRPRRRLDADGPRAPPRARGAAPAARRPAGSAAADRGRRPRQGQAPRHDRLLRRRRPADVVPRAGPARQGPLRADAVHHRGRLGHHAALRAAARDRQARRLHGSRALRPRWPTASRAASPTPSRRWGGGCSPPAPPSAPGSLRRPARPRPLRPESPEPPWVNVPRS